MFTFFLANISIIENIWKKYWKIYLHLYIYHFTICCHLFFFFDNFANQQSFISLSSFHIEPSKKYDHQFFLIYLHFSYRLSFYRLELHYIIFLIYMWLFIAASSRKTVILNFNLKGIFLFTLHFAWSFSIHFHNCFHPFVEQIMCVLCLFNINNIIDTPLS